MDWSGQWDHPGIHISDDAVNCNWRNHMAIPDLKFCLLDKLRDWNGLVQPDPTIRRICDHLQRQCNTFQVSMEKLFAVYISHLVRHALDRVKECAKLRNADLPSTELCRISLAVPIMTGEKESSLRSALREACERVGVDDRCLRLAHEARAACCAIVSGLTQKGRNNARDSSIYKEFRDGNEILVVDLGGSTTVSSLHAVSMLGASYRNGVHGIHRTYAEHTTRTGARRDFSLVNPQALPTEFISYGARWRKDFVAQLQRTGRRISANMWSQFRTRNSTSLTPLRMPRARILGTFPATQSGIQCFK